MAKQAANIPDLSAHFAEQRRQSVAAGNRLLAELAQALARGEPPPQETILSQVPFLFESVQLSDAAISQLPPDPLSVDRQALSDEAEKPAGSPSLVSSWFLADCAAYLLSDPNRYELLHLVTGSKSGDGLRTIDRMIPLPLSAHSAIHASANQQDLQKILIEFDEWGHSVHGLFHSHPGQGAEATKPSSIDLATHERWERGGYPLVGAIFVRDGYVRFFNQSGRPFTITIHGKGVTYVEENVYHIRHLSYRSPQPEERRADSHRPTRETGRVHPASAE